MTASGDLLDQATWLTDSDGFFEFYIGDELEAPDYYNANQYFDLKWGGTRTGIIDRIQIFPFIFGFVDAETENDLDDDQNGKPQQSIDRTIG